MCSIAELASRAETGLATLELPGPGSAAAGDDYLTVRALIEKLEIVGLQLLAAFDSSGAAAVDGSASTAAWVRRRTGASGRVLAADLHLARRLHTDPLRPLTTTAELLAADMLTVGHARVIARATGTLTAAAFDTAEPLIAKAALDLPVDVTAQVATQVADHAEALHVGGADDPVAARRAVADAGRRLHLSRCGDMWALDAMLTPEAGAALHTVLEPLAVLRPSPDGDVDTRSAAQRRADALEEAANLLLRTDQLPSHGGQRPQLTVLVDLDTLLARERSGTDGCGADARGAGGEGARAGGGWLTDGTSLSRDAIERIGCDARISTIITSTPAAEGGASAAGIALDHPAVRAALRRVAPALGGLPVEILDASRSQRLVAPGQRKALAVRDRGCVFPGCDRPPEWCDAHHLTSWSRGGNTDVRNLVLLCGRHHTTVHDHHWTLTRAPDGTITAQPPP